MHASETDLKKSATAFADAYEVRRLGFEFARICLDYAADVADAFSDDDGCGGSGASDAAPTAFIDELRAPATFYAAKRFVAMGYLSAEGATVATVALTMRGRAALRIVLATLGRHSATAVVDREGLATWLVRNGLLRERPARARPASPLSPITAGGQA